MWVLEYCTCSEGLVRGMLIRQICPCTPERSSRIRKWDEVPPPPVQVHVSLDSQVYTPQPRIILGWD